MYEAEIDISVSKLLGFETFAKSLRVSVSENLVSGKKSLFRFRKIWPQKKVSVSVLENLVSEKSLGFGFEKIWSRKKVSVSVSENLVSEKKSRFRFRKTLVSEKSLGFGKFGLGKEKILITRTVLAMMSQILDLVPIEAKALKWSHISPNSARPKFHPCGKMPC